MDSPHKISFAVQDTIRRCSVKSFSLFRFSNTQIPISIRNAKIESCLSPCPSTDAAERKAVLQLWCLEKRELASDRPTSRGHQHTHAAAEQPSTGPDTASANTLQETTAGGTFFRRISSW